MPEITDLLKDWNEGDEEAFGKVIPLVDVELRKIAHHYICRESRERLLQTTALVNEALMRLIQSNVPWYSRRQFYAIVARRMRQVLIDYANQRPDAGYLNAEHIGLDDAVIPDKRKSREVLLLHEVLKKFERQYRRPAIVVECRYFIGLTVKEIAALLHVSKATVERDWETARAWLKREMTGELVNE